MEIGGVVNHTPEVAVGESVKVTFFINGIITPFEFPFSNDSLSTPLLEFIDQNGQ